VYDCFGGYGWQVSTRHTGHIIRNSRFNNTKEGIEPSDALVYNNIISNTYHGFGLTQYYAPNKVYNNTFYNNAAGDVYGRNDLRNNIFQSARVRGNVTTQSGFVNAAGGDFHLTSSSAARGIGSNLSSVFTTDKDGVRHPSTGAWDVGAYQFTTAPRAVHRR
jgi:hypothetical protein